MADKATMPFCCAKEFQKSLFTDATYAMSTATVSAICTVQCLSQISLSFYKNDHNWKFLSQPCALIRHATIHLSSEKVNDSWRYRSALHSGSTDLLWNVCGKTNKMEPYNQSTGCRESREEGLGNAGMQWKEQEGQPGEEQQKQGDWSVSFSSEKGTEDPAPLPLLVS